MPPSRRVDDVAETDEDDRLYRIVVNHEEQYSIWFADQEPPAGWTIVGDPGTKDECLARITELWTDMRPLSLRQAMETAGHGGSE